MFCIYLTCKRIEMGEEWILSSILYLCLDTCDFCLIGDVSLKLGIISYTILRDLWNFVICYIVWICHLTILIELTIHFESRILLFIILHSLHMLFWYTERLVKDIEVKMSKCSCKFWIIISDIAKRFSCLDSFYIGCSSTTCWYYLTSFGMIIAFYRCSYNWLKRIFWISHISKDKNYLFIIRLSLLSRLFYILS